jgi:hypothetical protein
VAADFHPHNNHEPKVETFISHFNVSQAGPNYHFDTLGTLPRAHEAPMGPRTSFGTKISDDSNEKIKLIN